MNKNDIDYLKYARETLNIQGYPGNLFQHILKIENYIDKLNLTIFKQDLSDDLSGFIGYSQNDTAIICISYKKNIGHQNFTFAHELGHMILHKGLSITDVSKDMEMNSKEKIEYEANNFAAELLYPRINVDEDFKDIFMKKLIAKSKSIELADYINELCIKYCISFKFAFFRLFMDKYNNYDRLNKNYTSLIHTVGGLGKRYGKAIHSYVEGDQHYLPYNYTYELLKYYTDTLIKKQAISKETGEGIIYKNKFLEGAK